MNPQDYNPYSQPAPQPAQPQMPPQPVVSAPQVSPNQYGVVAPLQPMPQPVAPAQNPYEFILGNQAPKRSLLGGSLLQRVLVIVGGLVVLTIIGAVALSLFAPKSSAQTTFVGLVQEQQEIIRVTTDMMQYASSSDLKNAATTTNLSVTSDQKQFTTYLTANKVKLTQKELALKTDPANTKLLANAKATSTYDTTATKLLQSVLASYQTDLKTARLSIKGVKSGALLDKATSTDVLLITQASKLGQ